jgi:hypothetical protein
MAWNNRVIRKTYCQGKKTLHHYGVHEVYYNKKGVPDSWTANPIDLNGFDTIGDLRNSLAQIMRDARCGRTLLCVRYWPSPEALFLREWAMSVPTIT